MADYYVSPSGNDANAGTIGSPFRNWQRLKDFLTPGDTGYIRGGTYVPTTTTSTFIHCDWNGMVGTSTQPITIQNYQNEVPVYDFTGFITAIDASVCVDLNNSSYVKVKGLRVTGFAQAVSGNDINRGMVMEETTSCTFEQCTVDNMGGPGFVVGSNAVKAYFINCDASYCADPNTPGTPYGGADGFNISGNITGSDVTLIGCRAWWCSDDGFDNFNVNTVITYQNCWAFWNGYIPGTFTPVGNGTGFKLGPTNTVPLARTTRILYNCLAFENLDAGFGQNTAETRFSMLNCTAHKNTGNGWWFAWYPSYSQPFYNNIAWDNTAGEIDEAGGNIGGSNNTWDGVVTVSDADFLSVDSTGSDGARGADGSLPVLDYLHLAPGSDLINAGINRGLPFTGTAPDMGAFETSVQTHLSIGRKTASV